MITIDGSHGEGGGQILRSSLALSMITGKPFKLQNIRAKRDKPGLRRQHLTAVNAAARISSAYVQGNELASRELIFEPNAVQPGKYVFSIGTAGSTMLVLQTILPPLLLAKSPSSLTLEGGTHNPGAPPFDFVELAYLPVINRMGPSVSVALERPGFYPRGGGRFQVEIKPAERLAPTEIQERGPIELRRAKAVVAGLPPHVAGRELAVIREGTNWPPECFQLRELPAEYGPGNIVTIEVASQHITEVFTGFGVRGVRAEQVAAGALAQLERYLAADVPVGECLADQLLLPMALAGAGSFTTVAISQHSHTNIDVIRKFLEVEISARELGPDRHLVEINS